jgi:hypothetical protein
LVKDCRQFKTKTITWMPGNEPRAEGCPDFESAVGGPKVLKRQHFLQLAVLRLLSERCNDFAI